MPFEKELAAIRFGCGLSPKVAAASSPSEMIATLRGPDQVADQFRIEKFKTFRNRMKYQAQLARLTRNAETDEQRKEVEDAQRQLRRNARRDAIAWIQQDMLRRISTQDGFRERLVHFWSDHFTAAGKGGILISARAPYTESAIRPHVSGQFGDLLIAAVTHPLMLHYLDQNASVGPNSAFAQNRPDAGLNENLAREILELHTLGVDGPYSQTDVLAFARILTGLGYSAIDGRTFRGRRAEPGADTLLGQTYMGGIKDVEAALRDIAAHPATAQHIATKLAMHFVSDTPSDTLVGAIADRFYSSGGDLLHAYRAMLDHPDAWLEAGNVKQPIDMLGSALRALSVTETQLRGIRQQEFNIWFTESLRMMGQPLFAPTGPDGLPEEDSAWISPQGLAARLNWAMRVPSLLQQDLPDPRDFAQTALGQRLPASVAFAAQAAETRWEGIGVVLISPAFQTS